MYIHTHIHTYTYIEVQRADGSERARSSSSGAALKKTKSSRKKKEKKNSVALLSPRALVAEDTACERVRTRRAGEGGERAVKMSTSRSSRTAASAHQLAYSCSGSSGA
jgi:hypothetical protein